MDRIGTALQLAGLLIVGFGLFQGMATGDIRRELLLLAIGGAVFVLGWLAGKRGQWQS